MNNYVIIYTYQDPKFNELGHIHREGCEDIHKSKYDKCSSALVSELTPQDAARWAFADEFARGYTMGDVKIFPCALSV